MVQASNQHGAFRPDLLTLARDARGMTQSELARLSDVSQALISRVEDGTRAPSTEHLARFARVLDYPPEFFFLPDPIYGFGVGELFHRRRQSLAAKTLAKIHAQINVRCFHLRRLLKAIDWVDVGLPSAERELSDLSVDDAARALRARWLVPPGPVKSVCDVLDAAGILIIPCDFETPLIDAVGQWAPALPPIVFVHRAIPQDRLRWTLMHEIGHFVLHHGTSLSAITADIEDEANRFASEFLMPAKEIKPQLYDLSLAKLAQLKRQWRVSMQALLKRAADLGTITPRKAASLWTQMGKEGYRTREPQELDVHGEHPGALLDEIVRLHREELAYSAEELARLVTLRPHEARSLYLHEPATLRLLPPPDHNLAV